MAIGVLLENSKKVLAIPMFSDELDVGTVYSYIYALDISFKRKL